MSVISEQTRPIDTERAIGAQRLSESEGRNDNSSTKDATLSDRRDLPSSTNKISSAMIEMLISTGTDENNEGMDFSQQKEVSPNVNEVKSTQTNFP